MPLSAAPLHGNPDKGTFFAVYEARRYTASVSLPVLFIMLNLIPRGSFVYSAFAPLNPVRLFMLHFICKNMFVNLYRNSFPRHIF